MDNLCHSLVGWAMAEAGLRRRTRYATATLVIGANFPDIDVAIIPFGDSLAFRRGWTHGVLALVVLPFVLTGLVLAWDRWKRRRNSAHGDPPDGRQLLLLATLAILTHPALDFMNVYGVRWLMPFVDRWFYGDTLFIVDPWLWIALFTGAFLSRRAARRLEPGATRAARFALAGSAAYITLMAAVSAAAHARIERDLTQRLGVRPDRLMVEPVPAFSYRRDFVFEHDGSYGFGGLAVLPGTDVQLSQTRIPKGDDHPDVMRAKADPRSQAFLRWARYPFFIVEREGGTSRVSMVDARYGTDPRAGFATFRVELPARISLRRPHAPTEILACFDASRPGT